MTAESDRSHSLGRLFFRLVLLVPVLALASGPAVGHLLLAIPAIVAYEVAVLGAALLLQAHGEVRKRWSDGLTEAIGSALRRSLSPYARRYRRFLCEAHRDVDFRGPVPRLPLAEVFLPPGFEPERSGIWEGIRRSSGRTLAVEGAPGAGKTTLLKHLTLTMASNRRAGWPVGAPRHKTPILLGLRDHAAMISADPAVPLAELARRAARPTRAAEPPRWFDQQLETGRCVVLLDGLDEIGDQTTQEAVLAWIDQQAAAHPRCRFVLTSTAATRRDPISRSVLRIAPLTREQAHTLARAWHLAVERYHCPAKVSRPTTPLMRRLGTRDETDLRQRADHEASQLVEELGNDRAGEEILSNPLLLMMAANVRRFGRSAPTRPKDLYAETCEVLLTPRDRSEQVVPALSAAQTRQVLAVLASAMTAHGLAEIDVLEAADIVAPCLAEIRPQLDPADFLAATARHSGLLLKRPGNRYAFAHATLQAHLTAP